MKRYADHDPTTDDGRQALLDLLADDAIAYWEVFEERLRDSPAAQRTGIALAVARNVYSGAMLDHQRGVARLKPGVKESGPVGFLIFQACELMSAAQLTEVFAALDEVREARKARR